jgi:hypothetical protein
MPNNEFHRMITKMCLGKECGAVQRFMDAPSKTYGKGHRAFFHDPSDLSLLLPVILASKNPGDILDNYLAALLHISTDVIVSKVKRQLEQYGIQLNI